MSHSPVPSLRRTSSGLSAVGAGGGVADFETSGAVVVVVAGAGDICEQAPIGEEIDFLFREIDRCFDIETQMFQLLLQRAHLDRKRAIERAHCGTRLSRWAKRLDPRRPDRPTVKDLHTMKLNDAPQPSDSGYAISQWQDTDAIYERLQALLKAPLRPLRREPMDEVLNYFHRQCQG